MISDGFDIPEVSDLTENRDEIDEKPPNPGSDFIWMLILNYFLCFSNLWFAMMYSSRENSIRNQIWLLSIFWVSLFDPNAKIVESFLPPVTVKSVPVNRGLRGIDGLRGTAGLLGNRGLLVAVELGARASADARSALRASRRFSIADFLELTRRITPARCCCAAI